VVGISGVPDLASSSQLAQTYSQLAVQPIVALAADKILSPRYHGYRVEDHGLQSAASALQQQQFSPLIVLTVTDTVPQRAADAANAVSSAFISRINASNASRFAADQHSLKIQIAHEKAQADAINHKIAAYRGPSGGLEALKTAYAAYSTTYQSLVSSAEQLKLQRDISSSAVDVYSPATRPLSPTGPHPRNTALLWAFFALVAGTALVYGYQYLSDLCGDAEEASLLIDAPVLGAIPAFRVRRKQHPLLAGDGQMHVQDAEGYRMIRTNIQFANVDHPPRRILVTSALPGEGKTTTASNLALTFAEGGRSVTLIDGDLRRPSLHRVFDTPPGGGLTELILTDRLNGHRAGVTLRDNLTIVPSGPLPPNPGDLLGSERMAELMIHLRQQSDMVILDAPPVLAASDAAILSTVVDGVILVIDLNSTKRREIRHTREAIEAVGGKIIGIVINRVKSRERTYYYRSKYYSSGPHDGNLPDGTVDVPAGTETLAKSSRFSLPFGRKRTPSR
jgi:non-specific protein-tyrosine kinase